MRVLIAVQEKFYAEEQIEFVLNHYWQEPLSILLLNVVEPIGLAHQHEPGKNLLTELHSLHVENGTKLIQSLADRLAMKLPNANIQEKVLTGYAKEVILSEIELWQADVAVVGSHGRRDMIRKMIGSVSSAVLAYAPCSVMVVRP